MTNVDPDTKQTSDKEIVDLYADGARESTVLPGSDGTISGTAIEGWLDDDGNVKPESER